MAVTTGITARVNDAAIAPGRAMVGVQNEQELVGK